MNTTLTKAQETALRGAILRAQSNMIRIGSDEFEWHSKRGGNALGMGSTFDALVHAGMIIGEGDEAPRFYGVLFVSLEGWFYALAHDWISELPDFFYDYSEIQAYFVPASEPQVENPFCDGTCVDIPQDELVNGICVECRKQAVTDITPAAKPSFKIGDTVVISFKDTPISEHGVIIDKQGDEFVVQAKDHLGTLHYRKASELASPTVIDDITPAEPQTTSELETLQAENAKLRAQLEIAVQALKQHRTYVNRIGLQSSVRLMNETLAKIETLNS